MLINHVAQAVQPVWFQGDLLPLGTAAIPSKRCPMSNSKGNPRNQSTRPDLIGGFISVPNKVWTSPQFRKLPHSAQLGCISILFHYRPDKKRYRAEEIICPQRSKAVLLTKQGFCNSIPVLEKAGFITVERGMGTKGQNIYYRSEKWKDP